MLHGDRKDLSVLPLLADLASFSLLPESPCASVELTQAVSILVPGRGQLLLEP